MQSKTLAKHISYECKCKLDSKSRNQNQSSNKNKCPCEWNKPRHNVCEKDYIWNPAT